MKTIMLFLLVCSMHIVKGTTYYFSSVNGDDNRSAAEAQNPATPWKTLTKLNSIFSSLNPGDVVSLKRGDTFYGSINVSKSGTLSLPIIISAHGSGNKPIITGLISLSNWVSLGNGVWESYAPSLGGSVNTVLLNEAPQEMGRFPNSNAANKGYLSYETFNGNTSITDNQLSSFPNWAGAEVVIRKNPWIIDRNLITAHSGSTLFYNSGSSYSGVNNFGYFIQKDIRTLDRFGEWYYNSAQKKLSVYFGSNNPSSYNVKASSIDNLVYINSFNYIVFDNLSFTGANIYGLRLNGTQNVVVKNCDIIASGDGGVKATYTNNLIIENSFVSYSNNIGIDLENNNNNSIIRSNKVENTALFGGMGKSGDGNGTGINVRGQGNIIEYNEVLNTGYSGISFYDDVSILIKNNFVNNFSLTKSDGGGIYCHGGNSGVVTGGKRIIGNIVLNGIGAGEGTSDPTYLIAEGIYLDDGSSGTEIRNNTVGNVPHFGILYNNAKYVILRNNTFYNNGCQMEMLFTTTSTSGTNDDIYGNILFSKTPTQKIVSLKSTNDDIGDFAKFDSNYYARPLDDKLIIHTTKYYNTSQEANQALDLETWKAKYNKDAASKKSPVQIAPFIINNLIGPNKLVYNDGTFSTGIYGIGMWTPAGNGTATWDNTGAMDGGSVKIAFPPTGGPSNVSLVSLNVGAVSSSKQYILKYSLKGSNDNGISIGTYLRKAGEPYNDISTRSYAKISTTRSENEVLFSFPETDDNALLCFIVNDQNLTYFLDNIQFYEANVTKTDPDNYIRFEYNPSQSSKTVTLNGSYVDAKNQNYSNSITLKPYESVVLMKGTPSTVVDNTPPVIATKNITIQADGNGQATISPGDVLESVTDDSEVDYSTLQVSQTQFLCPSTTSNGTVSRQAYIATTTTGTQNFGGELGMEFKVNSTSGITINQLGAFDHQGNGITGTQNGGVRVAIFNKATKTIVPGLDAIIIGNSDSYNGNHRMKNITPVTLLPGDYVVVSKGYNANELNGNSAGGTPFASGDLGGGAITYANSCLFGSAGSGFSYPLNPDGGPGNRYLAGTFSYSTTSAATVSRQAYIATTTTGTQNFGGELGMEFKVNSTSGITINQLGAFDHQGNGITGTQNGGVRVAIFNKATKTIVPGLDAIIIGNSDSYNGNHRMKNITPVTLLPGDYVVVSKGYNANELNGNSAGGTPFAPGDLGGGAITYANSCLFGSAGSGFSYPLNPDGGPGNRYLAGTFSYSTTSAATVSRQAYIATTTTGTQNYEGELGMEFKVNSTSGITINQLGAFDHQGNGITGTQNGGVRVAIFNKATKTIVPGLDAIIIGNSDSYRGNHRMKNITPVTLLPGDYVVVSKGYSANELNGNSAGGTPFAPGDLGGGAITYANSCLFGSAGSGFAYPLNPDGGPGNRYLAGTFIYSTTSTGATNTNNYIVTVTVKDISGNIGQATATVTLDCSQSSLASMMAVPTEQSLREAIAEENLKVFPNPTRGQFSAQLFSSTASKISIQILSQSGRLIENKSLGMIESGVVSKVDFNLRNQPNGTYFVKIISAKGVQIRKIVILR